VVFLEAQFRFPCHYFRGNELESRMLLTQGQSHRTNVTERCALTLPNLGGIIVLFLQLIRFSR
jgi:hypothetical protein